MSVINIFDFKKGNENGITSKKNISGKRSRRESDDYKGCGIERSAESTRSSEESQRDTKKNSWLNLVLGARLALWLELLFWLWLLWSLRIFW